MQKSLVTLIKSCFRRLVFSTFTLNNHYLSYLLPGMHPPELYGQAHSQTWVEYTPGARETVAQYRKVDLSTQEDTDHHEGRDP